MKFGNILTNKDMEILCTFNCIRYTIKTNVRFTWLERREKYG